MYQRSDGSTGTVIAFVVSPDLNNVINAPLGGVDADGAIAFSIPDGVNLVVDELSLGFVKVHSLASVVNPIPALEHIKSVVSLHNNRSALIASFSSSSRLMRSVRLRA